MVFDVDAALSLATSAAAAFIKDLNSLICDAEAELKQLKHELDQQQSDLSEQRHRLEEHSALCASEHAELESLRDALQAEAFMLGERRMRLESDRRRLEDDKELFLKDRKLWGTETITFNASGTRISVLLPTVLQCQDSMLAAALSGRWSVPRDANGDIFVDFPARLFCPLIEHMQMRSIEDPALPVAPPSFDDDDVKAQFEKMLSYYGLLAWVYRPELVNHAIHLDKYSYAVFPPRPADEAAIGRDMQDQTLTLPTGWEVLSANHAEFEDAIHEMTSHYWGAQVVCVENGRGGFDSYRTSARTVGGSRGSVFETDIEWLTNVDTCRQFRFRGISGRLIIRTHREALDAAGYEEPSALQAALESDLAERDRALHLQ